MTLAIDAIRIDGAPVALDDVLADVVMRHGRVDAFDEPTSSAAQLTLVDVERPFVKSIHTGARLEVDVRAGDGAEFIYNGGAEEGLAGWTAFSATVVQQNYPHSGAFAFQVTAEGGYAGIAQTTPDAVVAEGIYRAEAWIYADASMVGRGGWIVVYVGGVQHTFGFFTLSAAGWNHWAMELPIPAGVSITVNVYLVDSVAGDVYLVDDVSFREVPQPRFTGRVTDCALDIDRLTLLATSTIATLFEYTVGLVDWPSETWSQRITRLFTEAGIPALLELDVPPIDPALAARPATDGPLKLSDALSTYAKMLDAAVVDRPNGNVFVQPLSSRTYAGKVTLNPDVIEYAPGWVQVLPEANIVTCKYAGGELTVRDDASIAIYGPLEMTLDTTFVDVAAATDRANERLARGAYPHWMVPAVPVLVGGMYAIGNMVELTEMPPASPYDPWAPIVEGWTDQVTANAGEIDWRMELALSDPSASGLTVPWSALNPADTWATINQTVKWKEAFTLDSIEGAGRAR